MKTLGKRGRENDQERDRDNDRSRNRERNSSLNSEETTASLPNVGEISHIHKRDGQIALFDLTRISNAVEKAFGTTSEGGSAEASEIAMNVYCKLMAWKRLHKQFVPDVEGVQDMVEKELMHSDFTKTAKCYIVYRQKRAEMRDMLQAKRRHVPERVKELFDESKKFFKDNPLGEFVYFRTYSRWIEGEQRRECWIETVDRYMSFMREKLGEKLHESEYEEIRFAILNHEVMPSMRLLQFSGDAARRNNICAFNCAYTAPTCIKDLVDIMYISMQGTGMGFSVENANVFQFPQIQRQTGEMLPLYVVEDSTEGWCDAYSAGLEAWYAGKDVEFDYSNVRKAGERLKVKGGRASGPEPLIKLLTYARTLLLSKQGQMLSPINMHDLICKSGGPAEGGGVRRAAMISLSNLDDTDMSKAKSVDNWWVTNPQRSIANNSAVYEKKPSTNELMREWMNLVEGKSGERGIFNRGSLIKMMPKRRIEHFKKIGVVVDDPNNAGEFIFSGIVGGNPCMEILLLMMEFCNLSEIIARPYDDKTSLKRKAHIATIIGTYQASLTDFKYISPKWKKNCEAEALLGVSITGMEDSPITHDPEVLRDLRDYINKTNEEYAKRFGINVSKATTAIKPSGTVSLVTDASPGLHARFSKFSLRRVRSGKIDALVDLLEDENMNWEPENGQTRENPTTVVFGWPRKAPDGAVLASHKTALEQLEFCKMVKLNYCEHNTSCTIYVSDSEWIAVLNWVYENWDCICGISFFPRDDSVYSLAPNEEITEETFLKLKRNMPDIDYSRIVEFEREDTTDVKSQLACSGGVCVLNA